MICRFKQYSPSRESAEIGKAIILGFKTGFMKAELDKVKRKREPYRLKPYGSWVQSYIPVDENALENIKRWNDIG